MMISTFFDFIFALSYAFVFSPNVESIASRTCTMLLQMLELDVYIGCHA